MDDIQKQIDEINSKLDIILEETERQRRHRSEMDDLKDDITRVGKEVFDSAVMELEEVHDSIKTGDILFLFKKLLRNINNITKTFEQLENIKDFVQDAAPVSRELFNDLMIKLDEMDRKGYFKVLKELSMMTDTFVEHYSTTDIRDFGEKIIIILDTVNNVTDPAVLKKINNIIETMKTTEIEKDKKISAISLIRELNSPESKRSLALLIKVLKSISKENN